MFNNMMNSEVTVIVSSRAETLLEYNGVLCEENENTITLRGVSINFAMLNFQKNIFGGNMSSYKQNIDKVILNKDYIISCNMK